MTFSRRGFIRTITAAAMAFGGGLFSRAVAWARTKKLAIPLSKAPKLKEIDGAATLKVKDLDILFIRDSGTTVKALDGKCTHQQCFVGYARERKRIECPCHGSIYETSGKVIRGPAPKNLRSYNASLDADRIILEIDEPD